MPKLLKYILYAGAFLISFLLFVYWLFPMEVLKTRATLAMERFLGPDYQVEIEAMDLYRLTGVRLRAVGIQKIAEGKSQPVLTIDRMKARFGLFSLLFGKPSLSFELRLGKGSLTGWVQQREEAWQIEGEMAALDLNQIPYFKLTSGLNLASSIEGQWTLLYFVKQPLRTEGKFKIAMDKLFLKPSTVPLGEMGTFPLPDLKLALSPSVVEAEIGKGSIQMTKLIFQGGDLQFDLKGRVFMASEVSRYRINLQGNFQFSEKLWGVVDPILPEAFLTELKKQKGKEDRLPLSISGQISTPQIYSGAMRLYPFKPF